LDEPFGALDAQTKVQLVRSCCGCGGGYGRRCCSWTHDIEEAIALSDRVLVMTRRPGQFKADFTIDLPRPRDFYEVRFTPAFQELHCDIWEATFGRGGAGSHAGAGRGGGEHLRARLGGTGGDGSAKRGGVT
jgi:NitT/TauT family transport system ATP-binding protein